MERCLRPGGLSYCFCYFFMSTILPFRPTITMTADDDSFSSYDSVSTTELTVGTTNTGTSVDMPSSSFAFRMGRVSCSSNVSACDSNIGRTDTTTNTFCVHCFFFNRDESILLRRLLQLLTVLQYTFLCSWCLHLGGLSRSIITGSSLIGEGFAIAYAFTPSLLLLLLLVRQQCDRDCFRNNDGSFDTDTDTSNFYDGCCCC